MKINFRQGIVSHQSDFLQIAGDNVRLKADNRSVTVTLAILDTDYTHSEDNTIENAWIGPFPVDSNPAHANAYLYLDFDPLTFERTFGWTTLPPAAQSVAPGSGNTEIIGAVPTAASPIIQGSFEVSGQYVLTTGKKIAVVSSTANDGLYTVQSATYNTTTGTTIIVVKEAVPSATANGFINLDFDIFSQPLMQTGRTWYDTANHRQYELDIHNNWVEVIRVFAARLNNATAFFSMSKNADFNGTQIGDSASVFAGRVLFAESNKPITRDDGTFFTTEDQFFTNQSRVDALRLESNVSRAKSVSGGTLAAFGIVAWKSAGAITSAQYNDTGDTVIGILTENTNSGEVGAVIVQGTVTNADWSWDAALVGKPLWVKDGGLVSINPYVENPTAYPIAQVPVARVLSTDTIIFEQGLGGIGPRGPIGIITDLPLANNELVQGVVSLSHAPANDIFPIAAGANHPILTGGPYSVDGHGHVATQISFETIPGSIASDDVQNAIAELNTKKLSLLGGTMQGVLTLDSNPTGDLDAATKLYVDALAQGIDAKEAVIVATIAELGGVYSISGGTGGTGSISNVDSTNLDGTFGSDYDLILGSRILVKDQDDAKENGIYVVIAPFTGSPLTTLNIERSSDFDENTEIRAGNFVLVRAGFDLAGTGWALTDIHPEDDIELNVHDITWTLVSAATSFTVDETTITIAGLNTISTLQAIDGGTVDALQWNSNDISLGSPPTNGQVLVYNTTGGYWTNSDPVSKLGDLTDVIVAGSPLVTDQVLKYNGTNWVNADDVGATELNGLTDVIVAGSPAVNNQVLTFDGSNWINADAQTGVSALDDLVDVVVAGSPLVTDQVLTFDGSNWVNANAQAGASALNDLTDVIIGGSPLVTDQVLKYNGTDWVNADDVGATELNGLTDVVIGGSPLVTDQVLKYNGTDWVNAAESVSTALPDYEKFVIGGSPNQVLNTNVSTIATTGSPVGTARLQVFRNGILQNEDTTSGSPIDGDFEVTGANQLTFSPDSLQPGGVVIIYVFS